MTPEGTQLYIMTSVVLGLQFEEFEFRLFLRDYHRDLRQQHPVQSFPPYSPQLVLDALIQQFDGEHDEGGLGRYGALRAFAQRSHRLDLCVNASDYGAMERRKSPLDIGRTSWFLGRELIHARLTLDFPGYNPYRSPRRLHVPMVREHIEHLLELLPDYLWWEAHDQADAIRNGLAPEKLAEVRRRLEIAGFQKLDKFGLYLTSFERLLVPDPSPL